MLASKMGATLDPSETIAVSNIDILGIEICARQTTSFDVEVGGFSFSRV